MRRDDTVRPVASRGIDRRIHQVVKAVSRLSLFPFFDLEAEGSERLRQKRGFVLLPKHQRWEDIPLLSLASPRPLYYVAKKELFEHGPAARFLRSLGGIPLDRRRPLKSRSSLREIIGHLRRGEGVAVFPEGTYHPNRIGPAHSGLVRYIRSQIRVPFIPVGICYGNGTLRRRVSVRFGNVSYGESFRSVEEFLEDIMGAVADLSLPAGSRGAVGVTVHGPNETEGKRGAGTRENL